MKVEITMQEVNDFIDKFNQQEKEINRLKEEVRELRNRFIGVTLAGTLGAVHPNKFTQELNEQSRLYSDRAVTNK